MVGNMGPNGYIQIDLNGIKTGGTESSFDIDGIFNRIKTAYNQPRPSVFYNLVSVTSTYEGKVSPFISPIIKDVITGDEVYIIIVLCTDDTYTITFADDDSVSVTGTT